LPVLEKALLFFPSTPTTVWSSTGFDQFNAQFLVAELREVAGRGDLVALDRLAFRLMPQPRFDGRQDPPLPHVVEELLPPRRHSPRAVSRRGIVDRQPKQHRSDAPRC